MACYDQALAVTQHYFHSILLVVTRPPDSRGGDIDPDAQRLEKQVLLRKSAGHEIPSLQTAVCLTVQETQLEISNAYI